MKEREIVKLSMKISNLDRFSYILFRLFGTTLSYHSSLSIAIWFWLVASQFRFCTADHMKRCSVILQFYRGCHHGFGLCSGLLLLKIYWLFLRQGFYRSSLNQFHFSFFLSYAVDFCSSSCYELLCTCQAFFDLFILNYCGYSQVSQVRFYLICILFCEHWDRLVYLFISYL